MREIKFRALDKRYREMQSPHDLYISGQGDEALNMNIHDRFIFMQYTGLKDKNGVEIYCSDTFKIGKHKFTVPDNLLEVGQLMAEGYDFLNGEVTGNIYENPELLKEETNQ